jgi:hypothetical protein
MIPILKGSPWGEEGLIPPRDKTNLRGILSSLNAEWLGLKAAMAVSEADPAPLNVWGSWLVGQEFTRWAGVYSCHFLF